MDNETLVTDIFNAVLFRDPSETELSDNVAALDSGALDQAGLIANLVDSNEYTRGVGSVAAHFLDILGTAPDLAVVSQVAPLINPAALGPSISSVSSAFLGLDGVAATGLDTAADAASFVTAAYQTILGRTPDAGGQAFWESVYESGGAGVVTAGIINSAENFAQESASIRSYGALRAAGESEPALAQLEALPNSATTAQIVEAALAVGDSGDVPQIPGVVNLDALGGTLTDPATADVASEAATLVDSADTASATNVSGFGADDTIELTGVTADGVDVSVSGGNTELEFVVDGTASIITLEGVSGFFTSVDEFNASTDFGDIVVAGAGDGDDPAPEPQPGGGDETIDLDALGGTLQAPASADATTGALTFQDDAAVASATDIAGFGGDDALSFVGVTADDVDVAVSGGNTEFEFVVDGTASVVTLTGVSGFFTSVSEFNADPDLGNVTFA